MRAPPVRSGPPTCYDRGRFAGESRRIETGARLRGIQDVPSVAASVTAAMIKAVPPPNAHQSGAEPSLRVPDA